MTLYFRSSIDETVKINKLSEGQSRLCRPKSATPGCSGGVDKWGCSEKCVASLRLPMPGRSAVWINRTVQKVRKLNKLYADQGRLGVVVWDVDDEAVQKVG